MDNALAWWRPRWRRAKSEDEARVSTTARFGGENENEPVLVATIHGPVEIEMAKDALAEAGIPAHVKQNSLGPVYGLSVGSFGSAEVWAPAPLAEQAYDLLVGMGLVQDAEDGEENDDAALL